MKDLSRNISMICNICGNDLFSTVDTSTFSLDDASDDTLVKCSDCGRIITKAALIEENQEIINANIEDLKEEAFKELDKELKKMFKKWR